MIIHTYIQTFIHTFKSYLLGRQQREVISNVISNYVNVTSGSMVNLTRVNFCSLSVLGLHK